MPLLEPIPPCSHPVRFVRWWVLESQCAICGADVPETALYDSEGCYYDRETL